MTATPNTNRTDSIGRARPSGHRRQLTMSAGIVVGSIGVVAGFGAGSASAIVDGADTSISQNPWQVALTSPDGEQFCGGSIVSDRIIVTAAHCTEGKAESDITIRAGVTDLTSNDGHLRNVTRIIEHPKYIQGVGDIAMLVLDKPLELGGDVQAITLATTRDVNAASGARVTGWGVQSENAEGAPSVLQSADVPLVNDADCSLIDDGNEDELCAGGTGTDSCYGDSGGPLSIATSNGRALAGVVSWGEECGGESAGVYAEVPTFAAWVTERIANPDAPAGERLPAPGANEFGDAEYGDAELSQLDANGDNIVQWSEFEPGFDDTDDDADSPDLNGDGIVNWEELVDA